MPRYDDRYGTTRLYVGHLSSRTRSRDLEHIFSRYGRVRHVDMKHDFAFVEFSDPRDADDAMYYLDGREVDGSRLVVEFAKGVPRGPGGSREYMGRGPTPGSGRCFNCGIDGHWARDCKAGDWKNKCYRCGSRGHIQRNCQNSPRKLSRRDRSFSRSPRHGRRQSSSLSQSRSYSQSRSPPKREHQRRDKKRTRSPSYSRSPEPKKARKPSLTPEKEELSPIERALSPSPSPTPKRAKLSTEGDMSESPRNRSRSPMSPERDSPVATRYESPPPPEANGRSPSPSPKHDGSPIDDYDDEKNHESPRGSESS